MEPEEFHEKYMTQPITLKKATQLVEFILEEATGLPAEFFNTHSIEEIEDKLGIPHYKVSGPKNMAELRQSWYERKPRHPFDLEYYRKPSPQVDEKLLSRF